MERGLQAAIKAKDVPTVARLLLKQARQAESEMPMEMWRGGQKEETLKLVTETLLQRNHELGTLWGLFLAWLAERDGERDWAERWIDRLRKRWAKEKFPRLRTVFSAWDWQGKMAAFLLDELEQVKGATEMANLALDEKGKHELAERWAEKGLFDQALKVTESMKDALERARALAKIAKAMAEAGLRKRALRVFENALKATDEICERWLRAIGLRFVAEAMAELGLFERAVKVAERIGTEGIEGARHESEAEEAAGELMLALGAIIKRAAEAGLFEEAIQLAEDSEVAGMRARWLAEIAGVMVQLGQKERAQKVLNQACEAVKEAKHPEEMVWGLVGIAKALAKMGQKKQAQKTFEQALTKAKRVKNEFSRAERMAEIADAMAEAKLFDQALIVAEKIEEPSGQAIALKAITHWMAKAGIRKASLWQKVLQIVEVMEEGAAEEYDDQAEALAETAKAMAEAGIWEEALWQQAIHVAKERTNTPEWSLTEIARAMAKGGRKGEAQKVLEQILAAQMKRGDEVSLQAGLLLEIAEALAEAGQKEQAQKFFEEALMTAKLQKGWLRAVAEGMAKYGFLDQALTVAEEIEDDYEQRWMLWTVAKKMAEEGRFEQALRAAEGIKLAKRESEAAELRIWALTSIAQAMARKGLEERALQVFEEAVKVAEWVKERKEQARFLQSIATAMAKAGMFKPALRLAEGIKEARWKANALGRIAEDMAEAGMKKEAREVFVQALSAVGAMKDPDEQAWTIGEIVTAKVEGLEKASEVAEKIRDAFKRSWALQKIAEAMIQKGLIDQALELAERVGIARMDLQAELLAKVAEALKEAGSFDQALKFFEQAIEVAKKANAEWVSVKSVSAIAEMGLWDQALRLVRGIKDAIWRARALNDIAEKLMEVGRERQAEEFFEQALREAERIESFDLRGRVIGEIAQTMAKSGWFKRALQVVEGIENEAVRTMVFWEMAVMLAKKGEAEKAAIIAERTEAERTRELPQIFTILVERAKEGDKESEQSFWRLLPFCRQSLWLAYRACGWLARLYPERAKEIVEAVRWIGT